KIRTMNNPVHMQIVTSLGASPTPIPWTDLYTSLQTGVVDGQENSLSTFRVPKLEEVQKFIILDGHVYSVLMLAISEKWLSTLPDDLRKVVDDAAEHYKELNRVISVENEEADREYLEANGVTIIDPPLSVKADFQAKTQGPVIESLKGKVDPDLLQGLLDAVAEAEAKL
ncbi:MAG: TRAP transporter substrate-binding protein, partial [Geminicoccaceae bacterium]|nr:TRAP transporter substrate-binding protein [Geminicoccaceae bacterium]